jgi:hypothetical protein
MTQSDIQTNDEVKVEESEELSDAQLEGVAGGAKPPSGDANPSDLFNQTVDTSEVIKP